MFKQMKYMFKMVACTALLMVCSMIATAQTTQKLSANKSNEYGLLYTLPATEIDVTIEAQRTVKTPGEFYQYAKKYLQIDPITERSERWELKSVTISSRGVSDAKERYVVQFKAGSVPFMIINDQNMPLSINTEKKYEIAAVKVPEAVAAQPTVLDGDDARRAMTEEMVKSTSTPKRAELAAARIMEIRQNRNEVVSGQADAMPTDGTAMKLALETMDGQEAALTAMFAGVQQTNTEVATFTIVPDSIDNQRIVVARLSTLDGIVDADNLAGAPIYLNIKVTERGSMPVNEKGIVKTFPKGGLAYRIPGRATVSAEYDGRTVASTQMQLTQAGVVFGLDPGLFVDKKAPAAAVFNPATGAIVELSTIAAPAN